MSQPPPWPYQQPYPNDAERPGSKAWIEQRYGRVAGFGHRIVPTLIDITLAVAITVILAGIGVVLVVAGVPQTQECGPAGTDSCAVPGSGSVALIVLAVVMFVLSFVASFAFVCWNHIWRVHRTGQSLGKKWCGLRIIDAVQGTHPPLGPAILRELINQLIGGMSWGWMLIDADSRTLADIAGSTHVIHHGR